MYLSTLQKSFVCLADDNQRQVRSFVTGQLCGQLPVHQHLRFLLYAHPLEEGRNTNDRRAMLFMRERRESGGGEMCRRALMHDTYLTRPLT